MGVVVLAPELVGHVELGSQVVLLHQPPGTIGTCYGVTILEAVTQLVAGVVSVVGEARRVAAAEGSGDGQHVEVVTRQATRLVVFIDAHVGHGTIGAGHDVVAVVLVVVGEGHVHRGTELDAVTHVVVDDGRFRELVHLLANDRTRTLVVTGTDAEGCLVTTTRQVDIVAVLLTKLSHGINPVGIVRVVVVDVGHFRVVVQFRDGGCRLVGVEVSLLEHHGVTVTIQHLVTIGLPGTVELVGEVHLGRTTATTAQLDFDDTVGTLYTPLGC